MNTDRAIFRLRERQEQAEEAFAAGGIPVGGPVSNANPVVEEFPVQMTAVDSSTPANFSWTEQTYDANGNLTPLVARHRPGQRLDG